MSVWIHIGDLQITNDGESGIRIRDAHGRCTEDSGKPRVYQLGEVQIDALLSLLDKRQEELENQPREDTPDQNEGEPEKNPSAQEENDARDPETVANDPVAEAAADEVEQKDKEEEVETEEDSATRQE